MATIGTALRQSPRVLSLLRSPLPLQSIAHFSSLPHHPSPLSSPLPTPLSPPTTTTQPRQTNINLTRPQTTQTPMMPMCGVPSAVWKRALSTASSISSSAIETEHKPLHQLELIRSPTSVTVTAKDGRAVEYSYVWLRDNCPCPACLHPMCTQRLVHTAMIPRTIQPRAMSFTNDGVRDYLKVIWGEGEGHESVYRVDDLFALKEAYDQLNTPNYGKILWDRSTFVKNSPAPHPRESLPLNLLPTVNYSAAMENDASLYQLLSNISTYGFTIVTDSPATAEDTSALGRRISPLKRTFFGEVWDIEQSPSNTDFADTAYTNLSVDFHVDNTYWHDGAGVQFFHILRQAKKGGENMICDGFRIIEKLRKQNKSAYDLLSTLSVTAHYVDNQNNIIYRQRAPIIRADELGNYLQLRYNNHDRTPAYLPPSLMDAFHSSYAALEKEIEDPRNHIRVLLQPGQILITDNWRVLHARDSFEGPRRLSGVYISHDEYIGRLLSLRNSLRSA